MTRATTTHLPLHTGRPKPRVALWDNARWIAVTLMIIGHGTLKLIATSDVSYAAYLFVYLFQVPALVAVSGYFAKATPPNLHQLRRLLTDLIIPYLIFETFWTVVNWVVRGGTFKLDYTTASWTLWFLLALAAWRVLLPYLVLLRYPLLISVVISVGAGYFADVGDQLSLARIAGMLPFFVFGWKLRQLKVTGRWLELRPAVVWRWRALAIALFVAAGVVLFTGIGFWRESLIRRFLLFDEPYASFGYHEWWAGAVRLATLAVGMILTVALLMLVPRRRVFFTAWGEATMYIYLLHTLFLYPLREFHVLDDHSSPLWLIGVVLLSIAISALLAQPFVRRLFHPVIEPKARWLLRST